MGKIIRMIERCLGCGTERELDIGLPRWSTVQCPGLRPSDSVYRDQMGLCPECAALVTEPVCTVGDFDGQLGRVSYLTETSKVRLGKSEPFVGALRRSAKAMRLKVSQT
jgi:hypothetical protein